MYIFDVIKSCFSLIYIFYPIYCSSDFAYFDFYLFRTLQNRMENPNKRPNKFYYYCIFYYFILLHLPIFKH